MHVLGIVPTPRPYELRQHWELDLAVTVAAAPMIMRIFEIMIRKKRFAFVQIYVNVQLHDTQATRQADKTQKEKKQRAE